MIRAGMAGLAQPVKCILHVPLLARQRAYQQQCVWVSRVEGKRELVVTSGRLELPGGVQGVARSQVRPGQFNPAAGRGGVLHRVDVWERAQEPIDQPRAACLGGAVRRQLGGLSLPS